jgi:hypothetical protein
MRNPRRWLSLLSDAGTTMNFTTNTSAVAACNAIARSRDPSGVDLSRLHLYFGAEKLNADVLRCTIAIPAPLGLELERRKVIRRRYLEGGIKRADRRQSLGSLPLKLPA